MFIYGETVSASFRKEHYDLIAHTTHNVVEHIADGINSIRYGESSLACAVRIVKGAIQEADTVKSEPQWAMIGGRVNLMDAVRFDAIEEMLLGLSG